MNSTVFYEFIENVVQGIVNKRENVINEYLKYVRDENLHLLTKTKKKKPLENSNCVMHSYFKHEMNVMLLIFKLD